MKTKQLIMPLFITCLLSLGFLVAMAVSAYILVFNLFFSTLGWVSKLISSFFTGLNLVVFTALFFLIIKIFRERRNEIRSDEEDDLSQY